MNRVIAYDEQGKEMGTYECPDAASMHTHTHPFELFTHASARDAVWVEIEGKLTEYDLLGIHFRIVNMKLCETRLYCKKGQYTYKPAEGKPE